MEGNKCGNVLWYSHWRTHPHADPHTENSISIIILIVVMIRRINDFTIINLVHITTIGINLSISIIQSKL